MPAKIVEIDPDGVAARHGILPGDILVSINGRRLRDVIDYQLLCDHHSFDLTLRRDGEDRRLAVEKGVGEHLGLRFGSSLFDGLKRCQNRCIFCFIDQLPPGVRKSLKVKDDDYRLSFLYGHFITLTNLTDTDVKRIVEQRLSPLYISLHATDRELHRRMLGMTGDDRAIERFQYLLHGEIDVHVQIVLCPDINDKDELYKTLDDLAELKGVLSVGIVPVGLTSQRKGLPELRRVSEEEALDLVDKIKRVQERSLASKGVPWVYLADEFYAATGRALPPAEMYADFPQVENGIGIARLFLDGIRSSTTALEEIGFKKKYIALTGTLARPYLEAAAAELQRTGVEIKVIGVENEFFGHGVTVAGLLAGDDVRRVLHEFSGADSLLIPDVMLNDDGVFVDDVLPGELSESCGIPVEVVPAGGADFIDWLIRSAD
ncbi:MAG: DUF512 domain-containing protein [Actinobacteria bacterium]|nr:DUF512 domain-containing protein [Actinomycetota bacterium]